VLRAGVVDAVAGAAAEVDRSQRLSRAAVQDGLGTAVCARHVDLAGVGVVRNAVGEVIGGDPGDDLVRARIDGGDLIGPGCRRIEPVEVGCEAQSVNLVEALDRGDDVEGGCIEHLHGAVTQVRDVEPVRGRVQVLVVEAGRAAGESDVAHHSQREVRRSLVGRGARAPGSDGNEKARSEE
jgi:hypothetical protein